MPPSKMSSSAAGSPYRSKSGAPKLSMPTTEEERIIRREGGKILAKMCGRGDDEFNHAYGPGSSGSGRGIGQQRSEFFAKCPPRVFPNFDRGELGLGRTLGMGTFCRVAEILEVRLKDEEGSENDVPRRSSTGTAGGSGSTHSRVSVLKQTRRGSGGLEIRGDGDGIGGQPMRTKGGGGRGGRGDGPERFREDEADDGEIYGEVDDVLDQVDHDKHYNMSPSNVRAFMERKCLRHTEDGAAPAARYAVKRLRADLGENERINGAIDLAVEARFLSALHHPNIVRMRGTVGGADPLSPGFFLVLDRLYDTLEQRMDDWRDRQRKFGGCCFGMLGADNEENRILLADRLKVAYDVAAVFRYLHGHNLIYRDIKTDNIGFDVRDDVKVFDFGLCKELTPADRTRDGNAYKLTSQTGSFRYMAPEVALGKPYDLSADVYSYGVLLWQILDMKHPFSNLSFTEYTSKVARNGHRPKYSSGNKWPAGTRRIAEECWDQEPLYRPEFERVAAAVKSDLMMVTYECDASIANRSAHMMTRSQCSGEVEVGRRDSD